MLDLARKNLAHFKNLEFILNQRQDLQIFSTGMFDLVFSLICLQHMPWPLAAEYIDEFARVCRQGGFVAFQLPSRPPRAQWKIRLRKSLVDGLPFGAGRLYRRWRHGNSVAFDTYYTPATTVEQRAATAGLERVHRELDRAAGPDTEGFFYIFRKPD
jgi:SAM-dependent methyltransferase